MAWKNIKQRSFADDLIEIHSAVQGKRIKSVNL